jgi:hypothetical protein
LFLFINTHKKYSPTLALLIFGLLIVYIFISLSCKDQTNQNLTSNIVFPASGVSFNKQVVPLFQQTCAAGGCHGGSQPAANLNLEYFTWDYLIDFQPKIVIGGSGKNSILYIDIAGNPQLMPPKQRLTQNQIDGVKTWIDEGAKNN